MPSFSSTVNTNVAPPAVSATASNVTYGEIRQSLGDYVYCVKKLYLFSNNLRQLAGLVKYQHYNVNGNIVVESLTPTIDPYQTQASLFYDTADKSVILDGQSSLNTNLLPNTFIKIEFFTTRVAKRDYLDAILPSANNFTQLETAMGKFSFFQDWESQISLTYLGQDIKIQPIKSDEPIQIEQPITAQSAATIQPIQITI
jgi:hypothetical protein